MQKMLSEILKADLYFEVISIKKLINFYNIK